MNKELISKLHSVNTWRDIAFEAVDEIEKLRNLAERIVNECIAGAIDYDEVPKELINIAARLVDIDLDSLPTIIIGSENIPVLEDDDYDYNEQIRAWAWINKNCNGISNVGYCPICGVRIQVRGCSPTASGKLTGSCDDTFTISQWDERQNR